MSIPAFCYLHFQLSADDRSYNGLIIYNLLVVC